MKPKYKFIDNALFFPKEGILVIGDLHIGYEEMLKESGLEFPINQIKEIKEDLRNILKQTKNLKKIIFIGDIKHFFYFENIEKNYFFEVLNLIEKYVSKENIYVIKGNHDTSDIMHGVKFLDYYISKNIAFIHGHINYPEIFSKNIKYIVIGHLHPSIALKDEKSNRVEKFKCFLIGKHKNKEVIVIPSFFNVIEGTDVNNYNEEYDENFSIIPYKDMINFEVYVIDEKSGKTLEFGKVRDLD